MRWQWKHANIRYHERRHSVSKVAELMHFYVTHYRGKTTINHSPWKHVPTQWIAYRVQINHDKLHVKRCETSGKETYKQNMEITRCMSNRFPSKHPSTRQHRKRYNEHNYESKRPPHSIVHNVQTSHNVSWCVMKKVEYSVKQARMHDVQTSEPR